jgi:hypothetical protein
MEEKSNLLINGKIIYRACRGPDIFALLATTPALIPVDIATIVSSQQVGAKFDAELVLFYPGSSGQQRGVVLERDAAIRGDLLRESQTQVIDTVLSS